MAPPRVVSGSTDLSAPGNSSPGTPPRSLAQRAALVRARPGPSYGEASAGVLHPPARPRQLLGPHDGETVAGELLHGGAGQRVRRALLRVVALDGPERDREQGAALRHERTHRRHRPVA